MKISHCSRSSLPRCIAIWILLLPAFLVAQEIPQHSRNRAVSQVQTMLPAIRDLCSELDLQLTRFQEASQTWEHKLSPAQQQNLQALSLKLKPTSNAGFFFIYKGREGLLRLVSFMVYYEPGNYANTKVWLLPPPLALNTGIEYAKGFKPDETPLIFADGIFEEVLLLYRETKPFYLIGIDCTIKPPKIGGLSYIGPLVFTEIDDFTMMANCKLTGASSPMGPAVYIAGGNMLFMANEIIGNAATLMGGGVCCASMDSAATPMLIGNRISRNTAPKGGGIAFNKDNGTLAAMNIVTDNTAQEAGGGIFLDAARSYILGNYVFQNQTSNHPSHGGGIYLHVPKTAILTGNFIINNTTTGNGAGIYVRGDGPALPNFSAIGLNYIAGNTSPLNGGGIAMENEANVVFLGNIVLNNTALNGAGLWCRQMNAGILANTISGNSAGDTLQPGLGGGIWMDEVKGSVSANTIQGNHAHSGAGIFYSSPAKQAGDYPVFALNKISNNAAVWGAGCYLMGDNQPEFLMNSVFRNTADSSGAGFFLIDGTDARFQGNNIYGNTCALKGAGMYCHGSGTQPSVKAGNAFQNNTALLGGGLYYTQGSLPGIEGNRFYNNKALQGGGIYCHENGGLIKDNSFDWNKAADKGGAVFVCPGMSPVIAANRFERNIGGHISSKQAGDALAGDGAKYTGRGGAVYTAGAGANPQISENFFKWNVTHQGHGGAIAVEEASQPLMHDNTYEANIAGYLTKDAGLGGAVFVSASDISLRREWFLQNMAFHGGALAVVDGALDSIIDATFLINIADKDSAGTGMGGACYVMGTGTDVVMGTPYEPCFFKYNTASLGGALAGDGEAFLWVQSDTFLHNQAGYFTGEGEGGAILLCNQAGGSIGGNGPDSLGNVFSGNTAGLPAHPGLANGGAVALLSAARGEIKGNYFVDHNAASRSGGAVFLMGTGVLAEVGGENEDEIIRYPFQHLMRGNIIRNNNNAKVFQIEMPVIPWPIDSLSFPDTLTLDSLVTTPVFPDTVPTYVSKPLASIPRIVTVEDDPCNGLNHFAYITQGRGGVLVSSISNFMNPIATDTLVSQDYTYDLCRWDSLLFVADGAAGIRVFNLAPLCTSGAIPVYSHSYVLNTDAIKVCIDPLQGILFVLGSDSLLYAFRSLPGQLLPLDTLAPPSGGLFSDIRSANGFLYAILSHGPFSEFLILEITPFGLSPLSTYMVDGLVTAVDVCCNQALLATWFELGGQHYGALKALDITNPFMISEMAGIPSFLELDAYYSAVALNGPYIHLGTNKGLVSYFLPSGMFEVFLMENPVRDLEVAGLELLISNGDPALQLYSPVTGMPMGTLAGMVMTDTLHCPWPSYADLPPDSVWRPSFPPLPDTLFVMNDTLLAAQGMKWAAGKASTLLLKGLKTGRDTVLLPLPDSIITMHGGFLAVEDTANARVRGNLIGGKAFEDANTASHFGGAISVLNAGDTVLIGQDDDPSNPAHYANYIQGNVARWGGGIALLHHQASPVQITNNHIGGHEKLEGNLARVWGGGIMAQDARLEVLHNRIIRNYTGFDSIPADTVFGFGGGMALLNAAADIQENWIIRNTATGNGGGIGIMLGQGQLTLQHNTLTENNGLSNLEPRAPVEQNRMKYDRPIPGLGDELFLSKFLKGSKLQDSCLIRYNILDHFGSFEAASVYGDTALWQDTSLLRMEHNLLHSMIGKTGRGAFSASVYLEQNTIAGPLYTDVLGGNYSLSTGSAHPWAGWNPASATGIMGNDTLRVPGDYASLTAALLAARPGDRILVARHYDSSQDSLPIRIPSAVAVTGMAFGDTLDLNITDSTLILGRGPASPVVLLDSTHPRTLLAGLKIAGGGRGLALSTAEGYLLANILCDNDSLDLSMVFRETGPFAFRDRVLMDHNTLTRRPLLVYENSGEHAEAYAAGDKTRILPGPVMSYNIMDLGSQLSRFALATYPLHPLLAIGFEMNDVFGLLQDTVPDDLSTYDTLLAVPSSVRQVSAYPLFTAPASRNFHLERGSPCLLGLDTLYCIVQDGQCLIGFDSACIVPVAIIAGTDTIYDTLWQCLYSWDTTLYTRLIGAQYANLTVDFKADTCAGCVPLTITLFPDVYYADRVDSLHLTWVVGSDTLYGDTLSLPFTAAGTYDVALYARGRYSGVGLNRKDYLTLYAPPTVFAGNDTLILQGDTIQLQAQVTGGSPPMQYSWLPVEGLEDPVVPITNAYPDSTTAYRILVTDTNGCAALDTLLIRVQQGYMSLRGRVYYLNQDSTPLTAGWVTLIPLLKSQADSVPLDSLGAFAFDSLVGDHAVTLRVEVPFGGVNATDALMVAQHFADIITLGGLHKTAGDVDASHFLNAVDALLILRRFCLLQQDFPAGDWAIPGLPLILAGRDSLVELPVGVLCTGDVNASYQPGAKEKAGPLLQAGPARPNYPAHSLILEVVHPMDVGSFSLILSLEERPWAVRAVMVPGSASPAVYHVVDHTLYIAWYDVNPRDLQAGDPLVHILLDPLVYQDAPALRLSAGPGSLISDAQAAIVPDQSLRYCWQEAAAPPHFWLGQNFPNPCQGSTAIDYILPVKGLVRFSVSDVLGRVWFETAEGIQQSGAHRLQLDTRHWPAGVYLYRLRHTGPAATHTAVGRMVVGSRK